MLPSGGVIASLRDDHCEIAAAVCGGRAGGDRWCLVDLAGRARTAGAAVHRGFVATLQPDANFGRILAAYGGVFVAGSLAWGMVVDKFRPDRWDVVGAMVCLVGVAVIMYAPRSS